MTGALNDDVYVTNVSSQFHKKVKGPSWLKKLSQRKKLSLRNLLQKQSNNHIR